MLGLPDYGFAAVARDSLQSIPEHSSTNKTGASFETRCGRFLVTRASWFLLPAYILIVACKVVKILVFLQIKPVEYVEMISSMRPNIWATLADEVPAWVSEKRNKASVDRTVRWLDECIALNSVKVHNYFLFLDGEF